MKPQVETYHSQSNNVEIVETPDKNPYNRPLTHLVIDDNIWMSNDKYEIDDAKRAANNAQGRCYVGGLGLGVILEELLNNKNVTEVIVVEISEDVVKVVLPWLFKRFPVDFRQKTTILLGDATTIDAVKNQKPFDWMYFDIWIDKDQTAKYLMVKCFKWAKQHSPNTILEAWLKPELEELEKLNIKDSENEDHTGS